MAKQLPRLASELRYVKFVHNSYENSTRFLDGNPSLASSSDDATESDEEMQNVISARWTWGDTCGYNVDELSKRSIPLQMTLLRNLKTMEAQRATPQVDEDVNEDVNILSYLDLRPSKNSQETPKQTTVPVFSGEWTRPKIYICLSCGQKYLDLCRLLDHQRSDHSLVECRHIELDEDVQSEDLINALTKAITQRPVCKAPPPAESYECAKCHFKVDSAALLHSHIYLCSGMTWAEPELNSNNQQNKPKVIFHRRRGISRKFSESSLRLNEKIRIDDTDYHKCLDCKKKLKSLSSLLKHQELYCRRRALVQIRIEPVVTRMRRKALAEKVITEEQSKKPALPEGAKKKSPVTTEAKRNAKGKRKNK